MLACHKNGLSTPCPCFGSVPGSGRLGITWGQASYARYPTDQTTGFASLNINRSTRASLSTRSTRTSALRSTACKGGRACRSRQARGHRLLRHRLEEARRSSFRCRMYVDGRNVFCWRPRCKLRNTMYLNEHTNVTLPSCVCMRVSMRVATCITPLRPCSPQQGSLVALHLSPTQQLLLKYWAKEICSICIITTTTTTEMRALSSSRTCPSRFMPSTCRRRPRLEALCPAGGLGRRHSRPLHPRPDHPQSLA